MLLIGVLTIWGATTDYIPSGELKPEKPRLKGGTELVVQHEVFSDLVNTVEVWRGAKGYYIYYGMPRQHLILASGPHESEPKTLKEAKRITGALLDYESVPNHPGVKALTWLILDIILARPLYMSIPAIIFPVYIYFYLLLIILPHILTEDRTTENACKGTA